LPPFKEHSSKHLSTPKHRNPTHTPTADAYIAFLQSGNHDDYWRVLGESGLTQERIESWDQPLTGGMERRGGEEGGGGFSFSSRRSCVHAGQTMLPCFFSAP